MTPKPPRPGEPATLSPLRRARPAAYGGLVAHPTDLAKRRIRVPPSNRRPTRSSPLLWLVAGLALGGLVAGIVVRSRAPVAVPEPPRVLSVRVQKPAVVDLPIRLEYPAELLPLEEAHLSPQDVSGHVTKIFVDRGDPVTVGQVLVKLDCEEEQAQKRQAAQALRRARAAKRLAAVTAQRVGQMREGKFISLQEFDTAQSQAESAAAQAADAEARLRRFIKRAQNCELRAPFTGTVTARYVDEGALLGPGSKAALTITNASRLRVTIHVVENDVRYIRLGIPAELRIHGFRDRIFHGKITRIVHALDRNTRTMPVEIEIPNEQGELKPGLFGRVSLVVDTHRNAVVVPVTGLVVQESGAFAYVFEPAPVATSAAPKPDRPKKRRWLGKKDAGDQPEEVAPVPGVVRRRPVTLGYDLGDRVEVVSGLRGGDLMVTAGHDLLSDGLKVQAVEGSDKAAAPGATPLAGHAAGATGPTPPPGKKPAPGTSK